MLQILQLDKSIIKCLIFVLKVIVYLFDEKQKHIVKTKCFWIIDDSSFQLQVVYDLVIDVKQKPHQHNHQGFLQFQMSTANNCLLRFHMFIIRDKL